MGFEETPRRAASAQFVVDREIGSAAAIREAMDPANQSLAEALRLSYRVLQVVIVILIAMFFVSGVHIVKTGESGVMTRFGKIVSVDGQEALQTGRAFNILPYPAGDFVTMEVENRSISAGNAFWPKVAANLTQEQAIGRARASAGLKPGVDGSVLTRDGDLAHLQVRADYEIIDPVRFVRSLPELAADRVVQLAVQRATVGVCAESTLQEIIDLSDAIKDDIKRRAQKHLDDLGCGILLNDVQLPDTKPPFAIVNAYGELQNAREEARRAVAAAENEASNILNSATPNHQTLLTIVEAYEQAEDLGDFALAAERLAAVNQALEDDETTGAVSEVIKRAWSFESEIDSTLGSEADRFLSILPTYLKQSELVVKSRWLDAYRNVLSRQDTEIFYVPAAMQKLNLQIRGIEDIQRLRGKLRMERRDRAQVLASMTGLKKFYKTAEQTQPGQAQSTLIVGEDGRIKPRGSE